MQPRDDAIRVPPPDLDAEPDGFVVTVDPGDRIHFLDWGGPAPTPRAPGVLAIHGISQTGWIWTPVARRLRGSLRVVAMDLRGHGLSDSPATGYEPDVLTEDAMAVAEGSGLLEPGDADARVVLAGHGFGAIVAAWTAARLGARCAGLLLVDGGWEDVAADADVEPDEFLRGLDEPPEVMNSMSAYLADRAGFDPASWDADQEQAARATVVEVPAGKVVPATRPHAVAGAVESMFAYDPLLVLPSVEGRIVALVAERRRGCSSHRSARPGTGRTLFGRSTSDCRRDVPRRRPQPHALPARRGVGRRSAARAYHSAVTTTRRSNAELPLHVRSIVDEIETEIGDLSPHAVAEIEGGELHTGEANGRVEAAVRQILEEIGEDPDRQGLAGTPERVHRMYTELTAGYHVDPERLINAAVFDVDYSEMVVVKDIPFYSLCEHHLLPFFGTAAVAYIPRGRVIGLSKIPRVVEMYARRLQVQERLTQQVAQFLETQLHPQGVGVVMEATHLCAVMRGVRKPGTIMTTSHVLGLFRTRDRTRAEFFAHLERRAPTA